MGGDAENADRGKHANPSHSFCAFIGHFLKETSTKFEEERKCFFFEDSLHPDDIKEFIAFERLIFNGGLVGL